MTNHSRSRRTIPALLLAVGGCGMLSGCIVMVVPAATSGLIARSAVRRNGGAETNAASTSAASHPAASGSTATASSNSGVPATNQQSQVSALVVPGSGTEAASAQPSAAGSTWYDVIRFEAKTALGTPNNLRSDVLRAKDAVPVLCGSRPTAVLIDAATIGAGDYSYVGSLHTMGYAIVLTTRLATLPSGQVAALTKEGIPAPIAGETLFARSANDAAGRARIAARYCVVGLVGSQADDFPGAAQPGTPNARSGWFLIAKH